MERSTETRMPEIYDINVRIGLQTKIENLRCDLANLCVVRAACKQM